MQARRTPGGRPFLIIAHRGAPNHAPENTIAGFDKALELGFTHVELDAQLTVGGPQRCPDFLPFVADAPPGRPQVSY